MKETIEKEIEKLTGAMDSTLVSKHQFKINVEAKFKLNILTSHLDLLQNHYLFIGRKVYQYKDSFRYSDVFENEDVLNKMSSIAIDFTEELYSKFKKDLLEFYIKRVEEQLISGVIVENSSCQFSNMVFEWKIECKRELMTMYRDILTDLENK